MQLELFFQIIGLCPTSLSVTKYKEDATLILSILSIAQAITISALTIFTLNFGNTNIPKKASANAWTVSIEQLSAAASHLIIIVESLKWRNLFLEVKMQVNNAWEALGVIAKPTMKRNEMIFWIAIIVVGVALDLKVIISYTNRPELFRYTLFILPSNLINFFRIVQIAYYVRHLQKVLKLMESEVEGISEQSEYNRSVVNQNIIQVTDTVPKLMRLRVAYQHLERANKAINCLAGHGLVANVLRIFLKGICGCFWIYVSIYNLNFHEVDGELVKGVWYLRTQESLSGNSTFRSHLRGDQFNSPSFVANKDD